MDIFLPLIAAHVVAAAVIAFASPSATDTRLASVEIITELCLNTIGKLDKSSDIGQSIAEYAFGFMLHTNCFLVLMSLSPPRSYSTSLKKLHWAAHNLFAPRRGLVRSHSTEIKSSRATFLMSRTASVILTATTFFRLHNHSLLPFSLAYSDFHPSRNSLLRQIITHQLTARDLLLRVEITTMAFLMPSLLLCTIHGAFSVIAVGIFASSPKDWPALYGNLSEAYTLRRWYSHFWHKLMRKAFIVNAAAFVDSVATTLNIGTSVALRRSLILLLSFMISGVMHTVTGWQTGPCETWMPLWQYLATGVAILLEEVVQAMFFLLRRRVQVKMSVVERVLLRILGYVWVTMWWLEVIPRAVYASTRCAGQHGHV